MRKIQTLCFIQSGRRILLGMKKRGFGSGRWNGFGGKPKEGESLEAAARRETREEAGITVDKLEPAGVLEFSFRDEPDVLEVHFFRVKEFAGEPIETEEMRPQWFTVDKIPFDQMWPDDRHWMPLFLAGKEFTGKFHFENPINGKILRLELHLATATENSAD